MQPSVLSDVFCPRQVYMTHFVRYSVAFCFVVIFKYENISYIFGTLLNRVDRSRVMDKGPFVNYVRMILAIFDPSYSRVRVRKIFQTPHTYSYVRFFDFFLYDEILIKNKTCHT